MEFPKIAFVSVSRSGEDEYLSTHSSELDAITASDNGCIADVAEYQLVGVRRRRIETSVVDF